MDSIVNTENVLCFVLELDIQQLQAVCQAFRVNQNGNQLSLRGRIMKCLNDRPEQLERLKDKIVQVYKAGIQYSKQQFTPQLLNPVECYSGPSMIYDFDDTPFMHLLKIQFYPTVFIVDEGGQKNISFSPSSEDSFLIDESWDRDKREHKIQIVLIFKSAGDYKHHTPPIPCKRLPYNMTLAVNDTVCNLPDLNIEESHRPWRPNVPIDITAHLNPNVGDSNPDSIHAIPSKSPETIKITWLNEDYVFTVGVFMVEKFYCEELIEKIGRRRSYNETKERIIRHLKAADMDMCIETMHISIVDPITRLRIKLPARGFRCAHLQCFDAYQYIQMNEDKETWKCPICGKHTDFDSIVIDDYFSTVLRSRKLSKEAEIVTLYRDGTWSTEKKQR